MLQNASAAFVLQGLVKCLAVLLGDTQHKQHKPALCMFDPRRSAPTLCLMHCLQAGCRKCAGCPTPPYSATAV